MGSHFHYWIDCNGVAFSIELLEWDRTFSGIGGKKILASRDFGDKGVGRFEVKKECYRV